MRWNPASAIVVNVAPTQVTFLDPGGAPVVLATVVYVTPPGPKLKVLAVGAPPPTGTPAVAIHVFDEEAPPPGVSKFDCLAALMTSALKTILERSLFRVRPEVLVRGAESVATTLGPYHRDLLAKALELGGAKRVRWPEEFGGA
jgi:hypothetical protein